MHTDRLGWNRAVRPAAQECWRALTSGHLLSWHTALVAIVISATVVVPIVRNESSIEYVDAVISSTLTALILIIPMVAVAAAEHRLRRASQRVALLAAAWLSLSFARPFVTDAVLLGLFGEVTVTSTASRIVTNLVWIGLTLVLVGTITTSHRRMRRATARLATALDTMRDATRRMARERELALAAIRDVVSSIRRARDQLLAQPDIDFDAVSAFAQLVRAHSHDFEHAAHRPASLAPTGTPPPRLAMPPLLHQLRATPASTVGMMCVLVLLPFSITIGPPWASIALGVVILLLDVAAGYALRRLPASHPAVAGIAFIVAWVLVGIAISASAFALNPAAASINLAPLVGIPVAALTVAIAIDASRRARERKHAETVNLAIATRAFAEQIAHSRAPERHAASTLHGRVQGRCVILAAHADEHTLTPDDIEHFRADTDQALDDLTDPQRIVAPPYDARLSALLAGWSPIIDIDLDTDDGAPPSLLDPQVAALANEVIDEALINAVKHSGARTARITIQSTGHAQIIVSVAAPGRLSLPVMPTRRFAQSTSLFQSGDDVVLQASIAVLPLTTPASITD